jgi:diguanylate cyclase (GGDEF)-like protein
MNELRRTDLGARYGGEELVLLLPACAQEEAAEVAERVRVGMQSGAPVPFTASAGVATFPLDAHNSSTLLAAADAALYRAKAAGRNRTAVSNPDGSTRRLRA